MYVYLLHIAVILGDVALNKFIWWIWFIWWEIQRWHIWESSSAWIGDDGDHGSEKRLVCLPSMFAAASAAAATSTFFCEPLGMLIGVWSGVSLWSNLWFTKIPQAASWKKKLKKCWEEKPISPRRQEQCERKARSRFMRLRNENAFQCQLTSTFIHEWVRCGHWNYGNSRGWVPGSKLNDGG